MHVPVTNPKMAGHRLDGLDALRGLAALSIVAFHTAFVPALAIPAWLSVVINYRLGHGVALFFVLSAFSLYFADSARVKDGRSIAGFYVRRLARIVPLFYVMMVVVMQMRREGFGETPSLAEVAANLTFVFNLVPAYAGSIVWAGWSIGVEMVFYLLLPLAFLWVKTLRAALILLGGSACVTIWAERAMPRLDPLHPDYSLICFCNNQVFFAVGIALYMLYLRLRERPEAQRLRLSRVLFIAGCVLLWGAFAINDRLNPWRAVRTWDWYLSAIGFGLITLSQALHAFRFVTNRFTVRAGQVSYGVYLLHMPVILLIVNAYRIVYAHAGGHHALAYGVCLLITLALVLPLALLAHHLIERPAMRLGKRVSQRLSGA